MGTVQHDGAGPGVDEESELDECVRSLRLLILAGENYRQSLAQTTGLGVTESQALSYLAVYGDRGQNELAADLGITSSACTALVDRLERQGVGERYAHPRDRRRMMVRLTERGQAIVRRSHDWLAVSLGSASAGALSGALRGVAHALRDESRRQLTG